MSKPEGQFCPPHLLDNLKHQDWPEAALYVVSTPIGNLADISYRAIYTLQLCDVIACEDTRTSKQLLSQLHIEPKKLMALHKFNETESIDLVASYLSEGLRVAMISDAGTPAVSDPGSVLIEAMLERGFRVVPIPGASAVITAVMASGVRPKDISLSGFSFLGFLPSKASERKGFIEQELTENIRPAVVFESPHRIEESMKDMMELLGEDRLITVCKELTKKFETAVRGSVREMVDWLAADSNNQKGEFVIIVEGVGIATREGEAESEKLLRLMLGKGVSVKDAVAVVHEFMSSPRKPIYDMALRIKSEGEGYG
ncbi:16S rRNA (cytidine(1402)-2'-O)-methyltransferase [Taylorella asinigenitalis]|uniref:Ribosomal RNA small subunit methyltransferase I n=1 Tax=Taylorella asinigenitalis (strain MCE3) TaxID=1008459 RepID=G4QDK7_TAYAM|nr:16S rRNA (cytidine(1402)-2'-O)-methyltransferase [Taylorella asinigenitalis]AEP36024.1 rRNA small subunit methyltransferase I [Taylorella asinigenitalis MCE3]